MSVVREVLVIVLLAVCTILTALSAVGVLVMRDPYQRLHYIAPPASSAFLLVAALAIDGAGIGACIKALLVIVLLNVSNGVLTHATARAMFVHERGKWPPDPGEATPVEGGEGGS